MITTSILHFVRNLLALSVFTVPASGIVKAEHADKQNFLMAEAYHHINIRHDQKTTERFTHWQNLLYHSLDKSETEKIRLVNDFFNHMTWVPDQQLWHKKDYWATPIESLIRNAGDCEDFTIAKYFTLLALDIPYERLRINYVKLSDQQSHMVLSYYPTLDSEPLILDNFNKQILSRHERNDLNFLFSFNSEKLWLSDHQVIVLDQENALNHWRNLMRRIEKEQG